MKPVFYKRDFSGKLPLPDTLNLQVRRYSHSMEGGPYKATITAAATADKWELRKLLRCPVEIYGSDGRLNWWGYVARVTIPQGEQNFGYSLDNMYNHVRVRYEDDGVTVAGTNAVSLSEYGQKELIIRSYSLNGIEATQLRETELKDKKNPTPEITFGSGDAVEIECLGWYETLRWKHYNNTTESNVSNTTQIETIVGDVGQFINGVLIEDSAGVVSNQERDYRDGLSCVNELLQAGTINNRPLLSRVDSNRYLHVWERGAAPVDGGNIDYIMRDDGRLIQKAGGSIVPDQHCTVAKWVKAKGSPNEFAFFIESAEYDVARDKTTYRPAGGYEQQRLARYIADTVTGEGRHIWPGLFKSENVLPDDNNFEPFWVALGLSTDTVDYIRDAVIINDYLYVAFGDLVDATQTIGGVTARGVARMSLLTGQWESLSNGGLLGLSGTGVALAAYGNYLIISGDFNNPGGAGPIASLLCVYDTVNGTWSDVGGSAVGPGSPYVQAYPSALYVDVDSDMLYCGGLIDLDGSQRILKCDLTSFTWGTLDTGIETSVLGIVASGSDVYAVGGGGVHAFDGASWSLLSNLGGGTGYCIEFWNAGFVVGGDFSTPGENVAYYNLDTVAWETLGDGVNDVCRAVGVVDNYAFFTGDFTSPGTRSAYFDGGEWYAMTEGLNGSGYAIVIDWELGPMFFGDYSTAGDITAINAAAYVNDLEELLKYMSSYGGIGGGVASPGGPDKAVQYNFNGRFGGEAALSWDYTNDNLQIGNYTVPIAGSKVIHQIQEGASPSHFLWAFTSSYAGFLTFMKANGDSGTPTALLADEVIGRIRWRGHDGSTWPDTRAEIRGIASENWSTSDHGARIHIYETLDGTTAMVRYPYVWRGKSAAPTTDNDTTEGYVVGDRWVDETNDKEYVCLDVTEGAAVWTETTGSGGGSWDGDITDIDETSSADIGEAIADDDQGIIYNTSGTAWVRFAWSRVKTYIQALTDTLYIAITGNVDQANLEELTDGSETTLHSHAGLTYNATTVTTGNVTAASGNHYDLTIAGMTADRDFNLPTPAAAGEKIALRVLDGDATYELICKANSVEITRVFIAGETLEFMSTGTGAGDWKVSDDGRIPCHGILERQSAQSIASNTYPVVVQLTTEVKDVGDIADNSTYKITLRRGNTYTIIGVVIFANAFSDQKNVQSLIHINNTLDTYQITYISTPTTTQPGMARVIYDRVLSAGDYIELVGYHNQGAAVNTGTTVGYPQLSVKEILEPI